MARKPKSGRRTKGGQLSRAKAALFERNGPNERVIARQDRFRHFQGDGSIGHEMTCAGRLMLVGAFDGLEVAPDAILSALLDYADGYWGYYKGGPKISKGERVSHGQDNGLTCPQSGLLIDKAGEWFDAIDAQLRSCGHETVRAVHNITVDRHWFPDEDVDWADRIINRRILDKRAAISRAGQAPPASLFVGGELACDSDWAMLELARQGAEAIALGRSPQRRAA